MTPVKLTLLVVYGHQLLNYTNLWTFQCSVSCGEGVKRREVNCVDLEGNRSQKCDDLMKPNISQACKTVECQMKVNDEMKGKKIVFQVLL